MFKKHIKKTMSMILSLGIAVGGTFAVPSVPAFAVSGVKIDEANFPDATFRTYISENFDTDATKGVLSVTELNAVTEIDLQSKGITSLKGVEYFTKLKYLTCTYGTFTSVDVSQNTELLDVYLSCNKLTSLDVSKNTKLISLDCYGNQLSVLNVSNNTQLQNLTCSENQISKLDVSKNTQLFALYCENNKLTSLDVSKNTKLEMLDCWRNPIPTLDVSNTPLKTLENGYKEVSTGYDCTTLRPSPTTYPPYLRYSNSTKVIFSKSSNNSSGSNSSNKNTNQSSKKKETKKYSNEWVDGKWYNADGSQTYKGTMKWKCNSKGWWIEDSAGWYPQSQWQKIDGKWYYFCSDGYMDYSEYRDGYWLGSDGAWVESYSGGKWYLDSTGWWYSDSSGWYPTNQWLWIDGTNYHFNAKGYCTNP